MNSIVSILLLIPVLFSGSFAISSCGNPPNISDGAGTDTNGIVTYTCDKGYVMNGKADNVTCLNSSWTGYPPTCALQNLSNNLYNSSKGNY